MFYILVDDILKAKFFSAFGKFSKVTFITNKLSCYFYLRSKTENKIVFLTKKNSKIKTYNPEKLGKTISVLNGRQSLQNAIDNYCEIYSALDIKLKDLITSKDTIILFNGNHASAIAVADYFALYKAKTLYCEISNLPGKMIFDPAGVNAQSILFQRPDVLDNLPLVTDEQHKHWVERYIAYKNSPLPQAKINLANYSIVAIDDIFSRIIPNLIREDSLPLIKKVKMFRDKYRSRKILADNIKADLKKEYVFYPTQVTSDTQLKINSDIDNITAITNIIKIEKNTQIFVKIHPAESNIETIHFFKNLAEQNKIILVNNNTIELIRSARKVYTINSTVGLEALIFDKDLVVLGRAIYSNFSPSRLKQYIHNYLVDLDYFSINDVDQTHIDKLKKLTEI